MDFYREKVKERDELRRQDEARRKQEFIDSGRQQAASIEIFKIELIEGILIQHLVDQIET